MTNRGTRVAVGMVLVPVAGIAAFYAVGTAAGARLAGQPTGMADAATVALLAVSGFAIAATAATVAMWRLSDRSLLPGAAGILFVSVALIVSAILMRRSVLAPAAVPDSATPTSAPIAVRGGDSLLAMMVLGTPPDGTGLLPFPLDLRGGPSDATAVLSTVTRWSDLQAEEVGYEEPSIAVYRIAFPWYLVSTRDSVLGWVRLPDGATVTPLVDLLPNRLNYLTTAWDGTIHEAPGRGPGQPVPGLVLDHGEASARVLDARQVGDAIWLHLEVHDRSPCESSTDPVVLATGWVPLWTNARPTVWYYSRGC